MQTFADLGILESMAVREKNVRVISKGKCGVLWEETPVTPCHWYVAVWLLDRDIEHPTAPWVLHGSDSGLSRPQYWVRRVNVVSPKVECSTTYSSCGDTIALDQMPLVCWICSRRLAPTLELMVQKGTHGLFIDNQGQACLSEGRTTAKKRQL